MKKLLTLFFVLTATIGMYAQFESAPAFPGAEGHGRFVTGGRGGKIIHVTNLNDSGAGSLREAVKGTAKKIVVFDVAGVIALNSDLGIGDNTTILGQTAPEPGITVRYYTVKPGGNNIIRFMRFRRGQEKDIDDGADACWQRYKTGIIFDHCSFSWSIDEVASFYDNNNFTMQWCTVGESLVNAGHNKGKHGYGGIWGGKLASFHHNMIAHVVNRGPRFNGARFKWTGYPANKDYKTYNWKNTVEAENVDFRNCVMYNAQGTCYGGPGGGQINIVNNYYKAGPGGSTSSSDQERVTKISAGESDNSTPADMTGMTSRYYIKGNTTVKTDGTVKQNRDWDGISCDDAVVYLNGTYYSEDNANYYTTVEHVTINGKSYVNIKMDAECPKGYVTTHSAEEAYNKVLKYVGASFYRDDVDSRYVQEAQNGTATYKGSVTRMAGLIDVVSDCKGYTEETFGTGAHPEGYDTDGDGMPDSWETAHGLNPADASDAVKYSLDAKGLYTNIEVYANGLVEDIMKAGNADALSTFDEYYPDKSAVAEPDEPTEPSETTEVVVLSYPDVDNANSITLSDGSTLTITGNAGKNISSGKDITVNGVAMKSIKLSNGAQNTFVAPAGKKVAKVTFYSYINKASDATERTSFWAEIDGTKYTVETAPVIMKSFQDGGNPDIATFDIAKKSQFTFTNSGDQLCFVMEITYGVPSGIEEITVTQEQYKDRVFNLQGQRVSANHKGIVIRNGRKYIQ